MSVLGESGSSSALVRTVREMTDSSLRNTDLSDHDVLIARLAVLVAIDAPQVSYLINLASGVGDTKLGPEEVESLLVAVAPLVGTAKVVSAAGLISDALGYPISVVDLLARP